MKRANNGFTLVELLIAAAILVILLGVLGALFGSTRRAYETNRDATASAGQLRSAVNAIQQDLAAAGFVGSRPDLIAAGTGLDITWCSDSQGRACGGYQNRDREVGALTVRYVETFDDAGANAVTVTYTVEDGQLLRTVNGQTHTLASGIVALDIVNYRRATGTPWRAVGNQPPGDWAGLDLRLHYERGGGIQSEDFTVSFRNEL